MTTYVAISWMGRAFYFNNLDREIANEIRDGSVAMQFIRPYNYIFVKMMQGFGEGLFRLSALHDTRDDLDLAVASDVSCRPIRACGSSI